MSKLIRSSLKLIFRNKAFWFFIVIIPFLSILILTKKSEGTFYKEKDKDGIIELKKEDDRVAYATYGSTNKYIVKVYDASGSDLSEYMLTKIGESGMFKVCRYKDLSMTKDKADKRADFDAFNDRAQLIIYLNPDFDKAVSEGKFDEAMTLYVVSDDQRYELFSMSFKDLLNDMGRAISQADGIDGALEILHEKDNMSLEKEVIEYQDKNEKTLTEKQYGQRSKIGYAMSILTLCYVFCGVFVSHTIVEEIKDKVLLRIKLTGTKTTTYFGAKIITAMITSVMITVSIWIELFIIKEESLGMAREKLVLMMFLMGIIFSIFSVLMGALIGNILTANYVAFTIWSLSSVFSGLFFPIDDMSKGLKSISYLMPQRWFMEASEKIICKDNNAYFMLLCITGAYLFVILCLGGVILKYKKNET